MLYRNYFWKEGRPKGIMPIANLTDPKTVNYRIISDPYYKWISIEQYIGENFQKVIYDSHLFDFRNLKPTNQTAWNKIFLEKTQERSLIRDQDDRIILFEDYTFERNYCKICKTYSVHNILVSTQCIYYTALGNRLNGVILFDANDHAVMYKIYDADENSGEFTTLKEENWNMTNEKVVEVFE